MVIPQQLVTQLLDSVNYQVNTSSQQLDKPELQTVTKMYQLKKKNLKRINFIHCTDLQITTWLSESLWLSREKVTNLHEGQMAFTSGHVDGRYKS